MCGIAAVLFVPGERPPEMQAEIREIFTRNLLFNEERGKAATGLAVLQSNGELEIYKAPISASEFVHTERYHALLNALTPQTVLWLGHTRLPTKGTPKNNDNNHPILAEEVLGVHNGRINNDDSLFARFDYHRQGEVDSEIIFRLLSDLNPQENEEGYLELVCRRLHLLEGKFTFIAADRRFPQRLLVLKHYNPLCVHYHAPWRALIFSSRYIFLRKAFGRSVITEALPNNTVLAYNANRLDALGNQPTHTCRLEK